MNKMFNTETINNDDQRTINMQFSTSLASRCCCLIKYETLKQQY